MIAKEMCTYKKKKISLISLRDKLPINSKMNSLFWSSNVIGKEMFHNKVPVFLGTYIYITIVQHYCILYTTFV